MRARPSLLLHSGSGLAVGLLSMAALALSACAPADDKTGASGSPTQSTATTTADSCSQDSLNLVRPGTLTIATDSPAYEPWFKDNDPTNGKGFEAAVAYAVAGEMGFTDSEVTWLKVPFNVSYAPGRKNFDFDINQISILPQREKAVDFSHPYYELTQAVITLKKSKYADATSLTAFKDARIGAQVGTSSLIGVKDVIQPTTDVQVYDDTNAAKQSLLNGQLDAIVADLPTAFYITAVEIPQATMVGQFSAQQSEELGLLLEKDNPLLRCVNVAVDALKADGTLDSLTQQWLSDVVDVPELS